MTHFEKMIEKDADYKVKHQVRIKVLNQVGVQVKHQVSMQISNQFASHLRGQVGLEIVNQFWGQVGVTSRESFEHPILRK